VPRPSTAHLRQTTLLGAIEGDLSGVPIDPHTGIAREQSAPPSLRRAPEPVTGAGLRDRGVSQVAAASPQFLARATEAIRSLARLDQPFTAEDVASLTGRPDRPNAMGAALISARKAGIIEKVGYVQATRKARHASALAVWRGVGHGPQTQARTDSAG
jgi:hypothetical protein